LEWRQRGIDQFEATQTHLDGRQSQIHTGMPGVIVSYDATKLTAVVQPALQAFQRNTDGTITPLTIANIPDVPVHFPGGGGHMLSFPVKAGDECWLSFSERSIDNWHQQGGVQKPSDWRMHDITDAVAHVGLRSQPKVPGGGSDLLRNSGAPVSATTVQLRSDDGMLLVELDPQGGKVTVKSANEIVLDCPKVTVTGRIECKGEVTGKFGSGGSVGLTTHRHTAGEPPPIGGS
jgi:hypothetical protein